MLTNPLFKPLSIVRCTDIEMKRSGIEIVLVLNEYIPRQPSMSKTEGLRIVHGWRSFMSGFRIVRSPSKADSKNNKVFQKIIKINCEIIVIVIK